MQLAHMCTVGQSMCAANIMCDLGVNSHMANLKVSCTVMCCPVPLTQPVQYMCVCAVLCRLTW
jgi:hypothetical protein